MITYEKAIERSVALSFINEDWNTDLSQRNCDGKWSATAVHKKEQRIIVVTGDDKYGTWFLLIDRLIEIWKGQNNAPMP